MAKLKTVYVCSECGGDSHKWQGQCPHCEAWNTLQEMRMDPARPAAVNRLSASHAALAGTAEVRALADIELGDVPRIPTGIEEFDRRFRLQHTLLPGDLSIIGLDVSHPCLGKQLIARSEEHTSELQSQ